MAAETDSTSRDTLVWLVRVVVLCAVAMLGLPVPEGYDIAQHIRFASAYQEALVNGVVVPSWSQFENFGFGSVGVRFYPPFADYILGLTQFLTEDWYESLLINSFFWMIPGSIGLFLWVREFRTSRTAFIAAAIYAAMPYHLLQIYRMQLYSEFVASAILPFCFLFATKIIRRNSAIDVIGLAVSCCLLIITHLPASLIGFTALMVFVAAMLDWRDSLKPVLRLAAAAAMTLALAAFYVVRLITEIGWVKHSGAEFSTGFFDHRRHFFPIVFSFGDGYWEYSLWRLDLPVILTLLLFFPLLIWLIRLRNSEATSKFERKALFAVSLTGLVTVFMLSSPSEFIWSFVPALQKIQFPWRFLSVSSLMASVAAATIASGVSGCGRHCTRILAFSTIALLVGMLVFDVTKVVLATDHLNREDYYKLHVDSRDTEGCECWWPIWANRDAFSKREKAKAGDRSIEILSWESTSREFLVGAGDPRDLRIATFYYPYWKADVNGEPVVPSTDENGAIVVPIQSDVSRVELNFEEPQYVKVGFHLSAFTALAVMLATIYLGVFRLKQMVVA